MKTLTLFMLSFSISLFANEHQNKNVGYPPNAVSRGQSEASGISESPAGTTKEEAQDFKSRNSGMGGAPNVGAGMGTGTGAGSTVGNEVEDDGTIGAESEAGARED